MLGDADLYNSDEFKMYCYKVLPCNVATGHDWTACPFYHAGEKAQRRCPKKFNYLPVACPDIRKGTKACPRGSNCCFSHSVFEYWLHPARYRTQLCSFGANCRRPLCFFAHSLLQLRAASPVNLSEGAASMLRLDSADITLDPMAPFSMNGTAHKLANHNAGRSNSMPACAGMGGDANSILGVASPFGQLDAFQCSTTGSAFLPAANSPLYTQSEENAASLQLFDMYATTRNGSGALPSPRATAAVAADPVDLAKQLMQLALNLRSESATAPSMTMTTATLASADSCSGGNGASSASKTSSSKKSSVKSASVSDDDCSSSSDEPASTASGGAKDTTCKSSSTQASSASGDEADPLLGLLAQLLSPQGGRQQQSSLLSEKSFEKPQQQQQQAQHQQRSSGNAPLTAYDLGQLQLQLAAQQQLQHMQAQQQVQLQQQHQQQQAALARLYAPLYNNGNATSASNNATGVSYPSTSFGMQSAAPLASTSGRPFVMPLNLSDANNCFGADDVARVSSKGSDGACYSAYSPSDNNSTCYSAFTPSGQMAAACEQQQAMAAALLSNGYGGCYTTGHNGSFRGAYMQSGYLGTTAF